MSFLLFNTQDPTTLKDALPDFTKVSHIFLPVNDCRDVTEAEGGTHWSLLLVSKVDGKAFHYDSLPPGNRQEAFVLTQKISVLLGRALRFIHLDDSPQQENGSDCGVFVCANMRYLLLRRLLAATSNEQISMSLGKIRVDATHERREMLKIIERLKSKSGGKVL
jgi:sentrin-specific protease 8